MRKAVMGGMVLLACSAVRGNDMQLGLMLGAGQSEYRGTEREAVVLPLFLYEGEHFFVAGRQFGWRVPINSWMSAGLVGELETTAFSPKDNKLTEFRQLDKRKPGVLAGGMLAVTLGEQANLGLSLLHDAGKRHRALIPSLQLDYSLTPADSRSHWSLRVAASHLPQKYMQYYYGIGIMESFRSGLPIYQARAGSRYALGLNWRYGLSRDTALLAHLGSEHLPDSLRWREGDRKGSAMVGRSSSTSAMLGFSYRF